MLFLSSSLWRQDIIINNLHNKSTSNRLLMKTSNAYDQIKVILFLHSVVFEMSIYFFSCSEADSSAFFLHMTVKLWHAVPFLLENVPGDERESLEGTSKELR